ncbi:MAG: flagellar hook-length control protein FliK [Gammaproteobacteria bacterium]|nr:flagellar hook-length control protein FliK [Gammaproteobacteria bacterium]MCW8910121.1 flagellar hook-length control protein FliK [Gammaproteobacteria bacterium]MCW9005250.1 flagellar hook-length control protein FliK [Gammaproteobacteria bacterium]
MINIPPIKPRTDIKTEILGDITKTWKVGQVLNATVDKGGQAMEAVQLRIGQLLLESRSPVALKTGDNIQLLVKQLGIEPLLSIKSPASSRDTAIQLLRNYINNQQDIKPLLQISQKLLTSDHLDTDIKLKLQQLIDSIAKPQQVTDTKQLKTLIQKTGVFLEPRLLQSSRMELKPGIISQDMKSQLQVISQQIKAELPVNQTPADSRGVKIDQVISQYLGGEISIKALGQFLSTQLPAEKLSLLLNQLQKNQNFTPQIKELLPQSIIQLLTHIQNQPNSKSLTDTLISLFIKLPILNDLKTNIDNLLNKIISQQLLPLTKDADSPQFFLFDLPVKHNKETTVFQFRIDEEKNPDKDKESSWSVLINFEFEELGPIQVKIKLYENNISTLFHAEKLTTADKINEHLSLLESALKSAGFNIGNISVLENRIQQPRNIPRDIHFLDEKA